jgi:ATP-binding cassette subfamily B protein
LIDGINIQDVTLSSLRRQIAIVPQETILFSGTIAQNIAFGQAEF